MPFSWRVFARHLLHNRIPIDLADLCNLIETVCNCFILAYKLFRHSETGTFRLTLPRSWIFNLTMCWESLANKDTHFGLLIAVLKLISDLLEQIYTRKDSGLFTPVKPYIYPSYA